MRFEMYQEREMNVQEILIVGAGGHGKIVAETAELLGYKVLGFADKAWPTRNMNGSWPIVSANIENHAGPVFCAIGNNETRESIFQKMGILDCPVLKHPSAIVSSKADLHKGTLVAANAVVNVDSIVGKGVILNTASSVDHDCLIGDFAHISPGARLAGNVTIGAKSWIGLGAVIREGIRIGVGCTVGAGAVVIKDVSDGEVVVGVPAKPLFLK